eukprot:3851846-Prymnesium_polylepis.1
MPGIDEEVCASSTGADLHVCPQPRAEAARPLACFAPRLSIASNRGARSKGAGREKRPPRVAAEPNTSRQHSRQHLTALCDRPLHSVARLTPGAGGARGLGVRAHRTRSAAPARNAHVRRSVLERAQGGLGVVGAAHGRGGVHPGRVRG